MPGLNTALETISAMENNRASIELIMFLESATYRIEPNVMRLAARSVVYQIVSLARMGRVIISKD